MLFRVYYLLGMIFFIFIHYLCSCHLSVEGSLLTYHYIFPK